MWCSCISSVLISFVVGLSRQNLFRFLHSKYKDQAVSKNTYYRFLNEVSYHWSKFLFLLVQKVISAFATLTRPKRVKVLVFDDSLYSRNRSKFVELLARVYDHVSHRFVKGFTMLTLGWSDGYSFVPVAFNLLSSAEKSNRYNEASTQMDKRTNGYKLRKESMLRKPEASIQMIQKALSTGIKVDYILMDTWFTTEPMIKEILATGKSFLKLGTEFQSHNYGAMVGHTTIVFTRYLLLEWIRRNRNDQKTYGELFFMFCLCSVRYSRYGNNESSSKFDSFICGTNFKAFNRFYLFHKK